MRLESAREFATLDSKFDLESKKIDSETRVEFCGLDS